MPDTVGGVQLNRFCASGLEAVNTAAQKVRSGWDDMVIAGGVESMSRVPMGSDGGAMMADPPPPTTPTSPPQGIGADLIATIEGFSRDDVDNYALQSQERAAEAWSGGYFAKVWCRSATRTACSSSTTTSTCAPTPPKEGLGKLKAAFEQAGRDGRLRRCGAAEVSLAGEDQPRPHRRQQLRHRRRRRPGAGGLRKGGQVAGPDPAGPDRGHRHHRCRPDHHADRPPPPR